MQPGELVPRSYIEGLLEKLTLMLKTPSGYSEQEVWQLCGMVNALHWTLNQLDNSLPIVAKIGGYWVDDSTYMAFRVPGCNLSFENRCTTEK